MEAESRKCMREAAAVGIIFLDACHVFEQEQQREREPDVSVCLSIPLVWKWEQRPAAVAVFN